jgi:hypothetical protein
MMLSLVMAGANHSGAANYKANRASLIEAGMEKLSRFSSNGKKSTEGYVKHRSTFCSVACGRRFRMAGQGYSMAQERVQRIIDLLSSTEMSVAEIAERMACSRSVVIAINRRFQVRDYSGFRTRWLKGERS